jgi:perosamine synthetase
MIPLAVPNLCGKEREYLNKCIDTTFVSTVGEFVNRFEDLIAYESGTAGSVCVNSGTSALHVGLVAVGVKRDELVILPTLTFIASANAIAYVGAEPWLMDIESESWTIDTNLLETELRENTEVRERGLYHKASGKRISCIMPVYTLGCPANMDELNRIATQYNLPIVADGAAALGAKYKGKGLANFADLTTFSFNGNKTITSGGGGALISKDLELLSRVKHLTTTARVGRDYYHDEVGFNYRMTNLEAAVGCAQIENLSRFIKRKREIRSFYNENLGDVDGVSCFPEPSWAESGCWFSGVVLNNYNEENYKDLIDRLEEAGIMARPFWMPVHLQPQFKNCYRTSMKESETLWSKILVLPCSTNITNDELKKVTDTFRRIFSSVL